MLRGLLVAFSAKLATAVIVAHDLPGTWVSYGCFTEGNGVRALTSASFVDPNAMTEQSCIAFCQSASFVFAGVEYSRECYCGNSFAGSSQNVTSGYADCSMPCTGNSTQACGGPNRLNIFWSGNQPPPPPIVNPGPPGWASVGCYIDSVNRRTLANGYETSGGAKQLTVQLCTSTCQANGFQYAGVEYGGECYCGDSLTTSMPASDGCNMLCSGNSSELCGGSNRLNLYHFGSSSSAPVAENSKTSMDASTAAASASTATTPAQPTSSKRPIVSDLTTSPISKTLTTSTAATTTISKSSSPSASTTSFRSTSSATSAEASTNLPPSTVLPTSASQSTGIAGSKPTDEQTPETSSTKATSELASGTSSLEATPSATSASSDAWTYKGCYIDNKYGRILGNGGTGGSAMTQESCISSCKMNGYSIAGMEFSTECYCGNQIIQGGQQTVDDDCAMTCGGDDQEYCGGPNRMTIFSNGAITVLEPPTVQKSHLPGSWAYQGCLSEGSGTRVFPHQQILKNNSAATCLAQCQKFGYMAGGMEYGDECYCGDESNIEIVGASLQSEDGCNMACSGNGSYLCGGSNRISYYTWSGSPFYNWSEPEGSAMGFYSYVVNSPVVPLVTTPGINGKVAILEKSGTSQTRGSTGAYEWDPLTNTFRTMHVKTDVFCAAGLVMPDRAGRQINVGGWSYDSTYGVRIYWPDGSPGNPSYNDWQENVQELTLQEGRWYPSLMMMTNGSLLVVGGEAGSNGAPVPTLELLPKAGPVVQCDWLRRTDPYNLYPYLAVLPSGGVFVAYYNEARVLSETDFSTMRELPNIPGSMENPAAGRTYPFEGSAVILPQHAPYDDPLTMMICGGSDGNGFAIDNCVSIQPETEKGWAIERMPSKRVMPCITALPDGTFLINNGAHRGQAGFGLADDANLNAVLYDPSQPVGSRMSIMANTTIARLYHSESVLLDDGRVLVSGSDPQDQTHPEEFRFETFSPPYLLSGQARPSFNISQRDWSYGGQYQIYNVRVPSGANKNLKVSLLAAVSSTHGNSMGQRTIFPTVSCQAAVCTVTAPPTAHICPPSWYQLWLLDDNNTPSVAAWVRIGGDPGSLGNWPNHPDFDLPGVGPL